MKNYAVILSIATLALAACSSTPEKEQVTLEQNIKAEEPVATPQQMLERAATSFSSIEGLSKEDQGKLAEIYTRTYMDSMSIRKDIGQSKSLLFKTLAKKDHKDSDIKKLKARIVELDQKRLNIMFKALDDVQKIVGKNTPASEKIYEHLERYEYPMAREQQL
ncbi:MAG: hypothetical protein ACLGGX_07100 [Bdellovibrionia bacterium]